MIIIITKSLKGFSNKELKSFLIKKLKNYLTQEAKEVSALWIQKVL